MFISRTPDHIFYSAGKTGTQTISSIPTTVQIVPIIHPWALQNPHLLRGRVHPWTVQQTGHLRASALKEIGRIMTTNNTKRIATPVTIIIREPTSRFISGLFEIIAKQTYAPWIELQVRAGVNPSLIEPQMDLWINPKFWDMAFDRILRLAPTTWEPSKELHSQRWQYHVGNWLSDVSVVEQYALELNTPISIVDISQLSLYLDSLGIEHKHWNKHSSMLHRLARDWPGYEHLYQRMDHSAINTEFRAAYARLDAGILAQFDNYLVEETAIYSQLKSKSIRF